MARWRGSLCLATCLLAGCSTDRSWTDRPSNAADWQAVEHNEIACAKRGLTFDLATWSCK